MSIELLPMNPIRKRKRRGMFRRTNPIDREAQPNLWANTEARMEAERAEIRKWAIEQSMNRKGIRAEAVAFLGGKCARCGIDDARVLQIDHVHGGGGREIKTKGYIKMCRDILAGRPGYQVLCANCNWIKRAENHEHR